MRREGTESSRLSIIKTAGQVGFYPCGLRVLSHHSTSREIKILRKQLGFSDNKVSFGRVRGLVEAYCIFRGKCITGKAP